MQVWLVGLFTFAAASAQAAGPAPGWTNARPIGEAEGLFAYRFEKGDLRYGDILTLQDGSKRLGKAMEWASQVLLFDADGRAAVFDVDDVAEIEFRRAARHKARPDLPDLTVAYVERLPRDPSWHGHVVVRDGLERADVTLDEAAWHPAVGSNVTFRVHVLNAGGSASGEVSCRILVDGREAKASRIPALKAGEEHVLEVSWPWQEGRHALRVEVDPDAATREIVRWNNTFVEPIDALGVTVVVSTDRYAAFRKSANIADSFCFEDWIQYQIRVLNALFAASVYPSAPQGILERVRCDRILVDAAPKPPPGRPDGLAEYAALWLHGPLSEEEVLDHDALKVNWGGLQHLGRQLGLVDLTTTDTTIQQCLVRDRHDRYVQRRHVFPWRHTMMYVAGGFPFDEPAAAFLNRTRGRPRGFRGDYLYGLPENIAVEVRSNAGTPLADVQVDAFQLMAEGEHAGAIAGYGRADPLFSGRTGADGRLRLVNRPAPAHETPGGYRLRPNPFGKIAVDGSSGLLLLRIRQDAVTEGAVVQEEFHFLRLFDCNVAHLRGRTREYVHLLSTRMGAPGAPPPPPYAAVRMEDRTADVPPMFIRWRMPPDTISNSIEEFRVYRRTSFAGDGAKPWTLVTTVGKQDGRWILRADGTYFEEFRTDGPYSLDTFYAVSTVDKQGRESGLSETAYLAYDKDSLTLTMDNTGDSMNDGAYITLSGDGPCRMIHWGGAAGMQPYGVRTRRFADYVPAFAGVAMAADGRLIVADPANHVLAFYDRGDLVELIPNRKWWPGFSSDEPGEFYSPQDVAVDDAGRIYVADRDNDRVQILDARGQFKAMLDEDFRFVGPHAVGYANGHLCVTDSSGTRCRVYGISESATGMQEAAWAFVCQLPPLADADRGLVSATGKVYISGRDEQAGAAGILVYTPEGDGAAFDHAGTEGKMGKFHHPRGLYLYRGGTGNHAYFVNEFPFDVRMYKLE